MDYEIRFATTDEWEEAMGVAWITFLEFEGDVYPQRGVQNFEEFITDTNLHRSFELGKYQMIVACKDGKIIGMISLRNESHISLLFVDKHYHRRGIGRALMIFLAEYVRREVGANRITVDSSPYAVGFYHRLGFIDQGPETIRDGIIFTPMALEI